MLRAHPATCLNTEMAVERHALLPAGSQRRPPAGRAASSGWLAGHQEPNFQVFAAAKSPRRRTTGNVLTTPFYVHSLNINTKYLYHVWCHHWAHASSMKEYCRTLRNSPLLNHATTWNVLHILLCHENTSSAWLKDFMSFIYIVFSHLVLWREANATLPFLLPLSTF